MSNHPRIEETDRGSLTTSRSRNSELWFINTQKLERAILGCTAKYLNRYDVSLYPLAIRAPTLFICVDHYRRSYPNITNNGCRLSKKIS